METTQIKNMVLALSGVIAAFVRPVIPVAVLCTAMVFVDMVSEDRMHRRGRRKGLEVPESKPLSLRLGMVIGTLVRIYVALCVAHGADIALDGALSQFTGGNSMLNVMGMLIFMWQMVSAIEKEGTYSDSPWYDRVKKYIERRLKDYLG